MTELEYSEFLKSETDLEYEAGLYSLEHYGIKGMKWGVRRTPEQLGHKTKKKSLVSRVKAASKKRAAAKKKAAAKTKKKEEESKDKIREKLLTSTDAKYLYKYRDYLDDKELQNRINRITTEQKLKSLIPDPKAKQKKALKEGEDFLKTAASMAESVSKVYASYDKIMNGGKSSNDQKKNDSNQQKQDEQKKKK